MCDLNSCIDLNSYIAANHTQRKNTEKLLGQFLNENELNLTSESLVMDIGSGDGGVAAEVLSKHLQEKFKKVIGIDVSEEMTDYATKKYKNDKLEFLQMDIATSALDVTLTNAFDFITSFFCLHWVSDQRLAFSNIYSMLRKNGLLLFIVIGKNNVFTTYDIMMNDVFWGDILKKIYMHPKIVNIENSVDIYKSMLQKEGYHIHKLENHSLKYHFEGWNEYIGFIKGINPYLSKLSPDLQNRYMEDFIDIQMKNSFLNILKDDKGSIIHVDFDCNHISGHVTK